MIVDGNHIRIIKRIKFKPAFHPGWMGKDPTVAFLVSIGSGPWKFQRRLNVQMTAIKWFRSHGYRDLSDVKRLSDIFPLDWQNDHLSSLVSSLRKKGITFKKQCNLWREDLWISSLAELFKMCGVPDRGTKVLWLFARDFLEIPSFPVDRWVERRLASLGLPADSWYMTFACIRAGVNPNVLARTMFAGVNPDFRSV